MICFCKAENNFSALETALSSLLLNIKVMPNIGNNIPIKERNINKDAAKEVFQPLSLSVFIGFFNNMYSVIAPKKPDK